MKKPFATSAWAGRLAIVALLVGLAGLAVISSSAAFGTSTSSRGAAIRLDGGFSLNGRVTYVDDVDGEHRGEHVHRVWTLVPRCQARVCARVALSRQRSAERIPNAILLRQKGGVYRGTGGFWIALSCGGDLNRHGGWATEAITTRVTASATVGTTRLATELTAQYTNPTRTNRTRCPGGLGRDAAIYHGRLSTPLPGPPRPSFSESVNRVTATAAFTDHSQPGTNGPRLVAWSWNFGDPASPDNTSKLRNPTHRYLVPGTYTVTLTVRDWYGQTATYTAQVTV